jgi:hypothetical protein
LNGDAGESQNVVIEDNTIVLFLAFAAVALQKHPIP